MRNNPLIPYVLIMTFGIGLIFFMSFEGAANKNSAEGDTSGETVELSGEEIAQKNCISCHGGDLKGSMGPSIVGLDAEHIKDVALNGTESGGMPAILKTEEEAKAVAEYISGL
ncbi:cytochrome C551 [Solibacillus sp. R5-41]|uniref:c-type cytochrome n=1 Tax=Solibacillus sp. R5-41 TaxID=2048654 RepID=UPI000C124552|nr:cytochrome c [Solibacillus sp. R5-41]ATP39487.1 cytochrome C551 [Solibacillus sp. R5-41]